MGLHHSPNMVTSGLVAYFDAANVKSYIGSGSSWGNIPATSYNATLTNTTFNSSNGGSIVFNGTNASAISSQPNLNPLTGDATVSVWFKTSTTPGGNSLLFTMKHPNNTSSSASVNIYVWNTGAISGYLRDNSANAAQTFSPLTTYPDGNWHNATMVKIGTSNLLYMDGVLVHTASNGSMGSVDCSTSNVYIGVANNGIQYFTGNISIVGYYLRALSAQEVLQNFCAHRARFGL